MIKTVTPARAAEILREHGMRTSAETLKYGLAQNKFPFGEAVGDGQAQPSLLRVDFRRVFEARGYAA